MDTKNSMIEQRRQCAVIGVVMVAVSLLFLFYIGSSLVSATQKYTKPACGYQNDNLYFESHQNRIFPSIWTVERKYANGFSYSVDV